MNTLDRLINVLLEEQPNYNGTVLPANINDKKRLFRSLVNTRLPSPIDDTFLHLQDSYLKQELEEKGVVYLNDLQEIQPQLYLWRGDITRLNVDAIVNAANSEMLGCFVPCHSCIDNAIHTFAGIQLRIECASIMQKQGYAEPTGHAKITPAYNLPSKYILHTVGPIINSKLREQDKQLLASCYRSCLELAEKNNVESIAFCCISTGVFHFPNDEAAKIAVNTVLDYHKTSGKHMRVIFNVFTEKDERIYKAILK